jgi:small subunit ribosomal protein S6
LSRRSALGPPDARLSDQRKTTGYYVVANFGADTSRLPEFERALKLDESLLRFLVVLNDNPPTPAQAIPPKPDDDEEDE